MANFQKAGFCESWHRAPAAIIPYKNACLWLFRTQILQANKIFTLSHLFGVLRLALLRHCLTNSISGRINIIGNFDGIYFPNLNSVAGKVHIQSTSSSFRCPNYLQSLLGHCGISTTSNSNLIRGSYQAICISAIFFYSNHKTSFQLLHGLGWARYYLCMLECQSFSGCHYD